MPRVLVIDQDYGALESFASILRLVGLDVVLATSGPEGRRIVRQHAIDLVLADRRFTDTSGLDVLKELRQEDIDVPLVIVTDLTSTACTIEAVVLAGRDSIERRAPADHVADPTDHHRLPPAFTPGEAASAHATKPQIVRVMRVIEQRFSEAGLTVRSVAQDLGISTEHLCRLLKRHTGSTFLAILRDTRVRAARQLLQSTTLSMKQIADRVGFGSGSRFDHNFRKVCGVSPTVYRIASMSEAAMKPGRPVMRDRRTDDRRTRSIAGLDMLVRSLSILGKQHQ